MTFKYKTKIALIENFGKDFVNARLRFALYLKDQGADVTAIIPDDGHSEQIRSQGIRVIEVNANIRSKNIFRAMAYGRHLYSIFKNEDFDIVHFYRFQPNIIGTFACGIASKSKVVNHITGLGYAFTSRGPKNKAFQKLIKSLYSINNLLFKPYFIFQNQQDIIDLGLKGKTVCIKGSSVNESKFNVALDEVKDSQLASLKEELKLHDGDKTIVFLFVSRLLKEKGVMELIDGFIRAHDESPKKMHLLLVGWSDPENPSSVRLDTLQELIRQRDDISFLGTRSDVEHLISLSDVSILPTYYREGVPRFLLESMACAKPIITTNMPGCGELVPNDENGQLIPPRSSEEIAKAILKISYRDLSLLGQKSLGLYNSEYSEEIVYSSIIQVYNQLLN